MSETVVIRPPRNHGARISDGESYIVLDATVNEEHRISAQVSDHPIETGGVFSDHVEVSPVEVTLTNIHTVTPTNEANVAPERDKDAWKLLRRLTEARAPLTVHTSLGTYTSMIITELTTSQSSSTGQSIRPVIRLRQIVTVSHSLADIPKELLAREVEDDAAADQDDGHRGADDSDEAETERGRSALAALDDATGRIFTGGAP